MDPKQSWWINYTPIVLLAAVILATPVLLSGVVNAQQKQGERYRITLKSRTFVPQPGLDSLVRENLMVQLRRAEKRYVIVQFLTLPNRSMRQRLVTKGIRLLAYINANAFYAVVDKPEAVNFAVVDKKNDPALSQIRWMGEIESRDRIAPDVLNGQFGEWAINADNSVKIRVTFFPDVNAETQSRMMKQYGIQFNRHSPNIWQLSIMRESIQNVMNENGVYWIEQEPAPYEPLNDVTRSRIGVDRVQNFNPATATFGGYSGDGIQVMVRDFGIDGDGVGNDHEDFQGRVLRTNTPDAGFCHGTHVAGILGGSGFRSNLNDAVGNANGGTAYQWRGMAPRVQLAGYYFGWDVATYSAAKATYGVDISNHSHVQDRNSIYNSDAVSVDNVVRDDTLYVVAAAGNNGTRQNNNSTLRGYFSVIGTVAKNALCLGSYNSANNLRSQFSSMGPTFDGRIKPDVVAPGSGIRSTVYDDTDPNHPEYRDDGYGLKDGTSMATPCAAGVVALMLEAFWDTHGWSTPRPLFSTIKAILVETATDLIQTPHVQGEPNCPDFTANNAQPPFFHAGPDWGTGYGLINAEAAVSAIGNNKLYLQNTIHDNDDVEVYAVFVPAGPPELKVTLAWDDPPGSPTSLNTTAKLVNDLNLELVAPDGRTVHYPWVLGPLDPTTDTNIDPTNITAATRGEDHVNNVEQVQVANPAVGFWVVRVSESGLPDPPQSFSLASNRPLIEWPNWSVSTHAGTAIPTGSFADNFNPGFNIILDASYHLSGHWSLAAYLGYNAFQSRATGVENTYWLNFSLNVRFDQPVPLMPTNSLSFYIQAGPGYYVPKSGTSTLGANIGAGLDQELSPSIFAEVGTDHHFLFSPDFRFWHAHAGIIIRL